MSQRDGQQLVRSAGGVVAFLSIDYVVEVASFGIPETRVERLPRSLCLSRQAICRSGSKLRPEPVSHEAQRVIPQCVDLHRLAPPGRHDPVANLGIHPGELIAWLSLPEQTVRWINANAEASAAQVEFDDLLQ